MKRTRDSSLPTGFLWGASVAAHQVEGGNRNDWSEWEQAHAEDLAARATRHFAHLLPRWDTVKTEATSPANYISGKAVDHYHLYKEDLAMAKSLGMTSFRFSLEWSRIEPSPGEFDEAALAHYRDVIRTCRQLGIEPFVTLWHWTNPTWLRDQGGWETVKACDYFVRYVSKVVEYMGSDVSFWLTLNEPEVYADFSFRIGEWPPQKHNTALARTVMRNLARGHRRAYRLIKLTNGAARIGVSKHNISLAVDRNMINRLLKFSLDYFWNYYFLRLIRGYQDYIGLNYYMHSRTPFSIKAGHRAHYSDLGWELYPQGLMQVLKGLSGYRLPIYITENGLADATDTYRADYIRQVVHVLERAVEQGIDVRGYSHWSLLDNFEWDKGFWPKFGLIAVDRTTMKRTIRPSAHAYAEIIRHNGTVDRSDNAHDL